MVAEPPKVMSTYVVLYATSVLIRLLVLHTSENTHSLHYDAQDFNQAALDGALCLFLSGQPSSCLQGQTEEDLGVISNNPSTHERSLQSRQAYAFRRRCASHRSGKPRANMNSYLLTQLRL